MEDGVLNQIVKLFDLIALAVIFTVGLTLSAIALASTPSQSTSVPLIIVAFIAASSWRHIRSSWQLGRVRVAESVIHDVPQSEPLRNEPRLSFLLLCIAGVYLLLRRRSN